MAPTCEGVKHKTSQANHEELQPVGVRKHLEAEVLHQQDRAYAYASTNKEAIKATADPQRGSVPGEGHAWRKEETCANTTFL